MQVVLLFVEDLSRKTALRGRFRRMRKRRWDSSSGRIGHGGSFRGWIFWRDGPIVRDRLDGVGTFDVWLCDVNPSDEKRMSMNSPEELLSVDDSV